MKKWKGSGVHSHQLHAMLESVACKASRDEIHSAYILA